MACSQYEYVKLFEKPLHLLQNTWLVIRIDGHGFSRFTSSHNFTKPNDIRALHLANHCARQVMNEFNDIILSYGESDEFSFVFRRECNMFQRREMKLVSTLVSLFTSNYVCAWRDFFPDLPLQYPPSFDGRAILYPTAKNLHDYLSWRQADCHINNLVPLYLRLFKVFTE